MSIPIVVCRVKKALTDDKVLRSLVNDLKYNLKWRAFTILPCIHHEPRCQITKEDEERIKRRIEELDL